MSSPHTSTSKFMDVRLTWALKGSNHWRMAAARGSMACLPFTGMSSSVWMSSARNVVATATAAPPATMTVAAANALLTILSPVAMPSTVALSATRGRLSLAVDGSYFALTAGG
eukprot:TRINITY_DN5224_c0_g1_i1.p2 TRINITY_DN5224_c0_g1~~TRINITY_DN5224_c0_g1_i1.p2  ORF type:complete len:113 (+),score=4.19 TRINITY_DN5224_c0_g1_i1:106-444(+)